MALDLLLRAVKVVVLPDVVPVLQSSLVAVDTGVVGKLVAVELVI